jgi:hypothetical protein
MRKREETPAIKEWLEFVEKHRDIFEKIADNLKKRKK